MVVTFILGVVVGAVVTFFVVQANPNSAKKLDKEADKLKDKISDKIK